MIARTLQTLENIIGEVEAGFTAVVMLDPAMSHLGGEDYRAFPI